MPLLGTKGAASAQGFGFLRAATGASGFIAFSPYNLNTGATSAAGVVAVTSTGVIMISGFGVTSGCVVNPGNLSVLTSAGAQTSATGLWKGASSGLPSTTFTYRESNDSVYWSNSSDADASAVFQFTSASTTPSTTSSAQYRQTYSSTGWDTGYLIGECEIDGSGNLYQIGFSIKQVCCVPYYRPLIAKSTMASGVSYVRGQTTFSSTLPNIIPSNCKLHSATYMSVVGSYYASPQELYFARVTLSTGAVDNQKRYTGISTQGSAPSLDVDSSNNSYVVSASSTLIYLTKLNSTGTFTWAKTISGAGAVNTLSVKVGPDGYIYVYAATTFTSTSQPQLALFKFDSSGTLQWQRTLSGSSTSMTAYGSGSYAKNGITVDSAGFVYVCARMKLPSNSYDTIVVWKYGTSGATTGTYTVPSSPSQAMTIAAGSYTIATASTPTTTAVTLTFGNATLGSVNTTNTLVTTNISGRTTNTVKT